MKVTAKQFAEVLEDNEEDMGEMAAYHVTCEQLNVDPEDGWDLLREASKNEQ